MHKDPVYFTNANVSLIKVYDEQLIKEALNYIINTGLYHKAENVRCISIWAIGKLFLVKKYRFDDVNIKTILKNSKEDSKVIVRKMGHWLNAQIEQNFQTPNKISANADQVP